MASSTPTHLNNTEDQINVNNKVDVEALEREDDARGLAGLFASKVVVLSALMAAVGGLTFGYDQGVVSITLVMESFLHEIPKVDDAVDSSASFNRGLMTAILQLGAMIGAASSGYLADKWSRRVALRIAVVWFVIGSSIQAGTISYAMLVVGRLIGGIGIGSLSMVAPLYIAEVSPKSIRGTLLCLEEFAIVLGICVAFWITYGTRFIDSTWSWRFPFLLQILPGLFLGAGSFLLPPSPRWLAGKGRDQECLEVLSRLRQRSIDHPIVVKEWIEIRCEVALNEEVKRERHPKLLNGTWSSDMKLEVASWMDTLRPGCRNRTLVGVGLMFFQQFVGINALIYYSPTLFKELGLSSEMQLTMSGVMNVLQLVGVTASFFVIDRFGRKPVLNFGSVTMAIPLFIVAILVARFNTDWPSHQPAAWTGVAMIFIYMVCFGLSWGPVPWAMPSEIFPSTLRSKGVALSTLSNWLNNFIIGLITPVMISNISYGTFIFFGVFSVLSLIFTWFCVPETVGKSLEQMDQVFGDNQGEDDLRRTRRIEKEILVKSKGGTVSEQSVSEVGKVILDENEDSKKSDDKDFAQI